MNYICSDIHGEYDLFIKLLNKINFSDNDTLYVCGDVVEKGPDSIKLLKFIFGKSNIKMIMGNHEYGFLKYYHILMSQLSDNVDYDKVLAVLQDYFSDGYLLDWDTVDRIESLPFYIETDDFICVHSGVPVLEDNNIEKLSNVKPEYFVYDRHFKEPTVLPNTSKCIFYGHTPSTYLINDAKIIKYSKKSCPHTITDFCKIHLDVGTWICGIMGCMCMETLAEYYVSK